jgi:hypothetical protein
MRLSWYGDTGVAVFSIWQGGRCTGTFRLPVDELPRMVETLRTGPDADQGAPRGGYDVSGAHDISGAHGGPYAPRGRDDADGPRPPRPVDEAATSYLMEPPPDGYDRGASYPGPPAPRRGADPLAASAPGPGPAAPLPGPGYQPAGGRPDPLSDPLDQLADPLGLGYRGAEAGGYRGGAPYAPAEDGRTDPGDGAGYRGDSRYAAGGEPGYLSGGHDYPAPDSRRYGAGDAPAYRARESRPYGAPDAPAYRTGDRQDYPPADGPGYLPADGRDYAEPRGREYPDYAARDGSGFAPDERHQYPAGDGYPGGDPRDFPTGDMPGYRPGGHSYPQRDAGYPGAGDEYPGDDDPRYGPVQHGSRRERRLAADSHGSAPY